MCFEKQYVTFCLGWRRSIARHHLSACCLLQMWRGNCCTGMLPRIWTLFWVWQQSVWALAVCSLQSADWTPFKWEPKYGEFCRRFLLSATKHPNSGTQLKGKLLCTEQWKTNPFRESQLVELDIDSYLCKYKWSQVISELTWKTCQVNVPKW